ncbi:winged helix-turn-helix domain-containing protein [Chloroflexota bacterium]
MENKNVFLRLEKGQGVESYKESEEIYLNKESTVIGRPSPANSPDIIIRNDYVSRGHLSIYFSDEEQQFFLKERDSGTPNGTYIDGKQVEPGRAYPLKDGDLIGVALHDEDYSVIFRFRESPGTLPGNRDIGDLSKKGLAVNIGARVVLLNGKEVNLRKKEFDLLAYLYRNRGKACSKSEIAENVWVEEKGYVSNETIDQNIHRIRQNIESDPANPKYIILLRNYGYRLEL